MKQLAIEWVATVRQIAKRDFEKVFKAMIEGYFGFQLEVLGEIVLQVFAVKTGINAQQMMRLVAVRPQNIMPQYPGVCVQVSTNNGTQGYVCLLRSSVLSDEDLESLIEEGPFPKRAPRVQGGVDTKVTDGCARHSPAPVPAQIPEVAPSQEVQSDSVGPAVPEVSDVTSSYGQVAEPSSASDLSVRSRLLRIGVPDDEIEKLKVTMASIMQAYMDEHGLQDPPHTFEVSISRITQAIREEMGLATNGRGNYQGIIGSFYSAKITIFGIRLDKRSKGNWILDGNTILDFVGGVDSLPGLKLQHVARLGAIEAATSVHEAAREALGAVGGVGDADDLAIIKLAQNALAAQEEAGRRRNAAQQNLELLLAEAKRLEQELEAVKDAIPEARELLAEAERAVAAYNFPPELHDRVRVAYARLGDILRKIGGNSKG